MVIKKAEFLTSVADSKNILDLNVPEYAFVGRSNSGKSSLINSLTNKKGLAKTSSTPGLTKLINYFEINKGSDDAFLLVDLPGYGFSKAGKTNHTLWSDLIENYFLNSKNLSRVFVLMDIRHEPTDLDQQMLLFLYHYQIPFTVIATKADKVAKSKIPAQVNLIAKGTKLASGNIIAYSSENCYGKDKILNVFEENKKTED